MSNQSLRLKRSLQRWWVRAEKARWIYGSQGRLNADGTVTVKADRDGFRYVTLDTGTLTIARNVAGVPERAGLPVRLRQEQGILIIDGQDDRLLEGDANAPVTIYTVNDVLPDSHGNISLNLASLNDVEDSTPASGSVPQYNDFDNLYHPTAINALGLTLDDLNGVDVLTPTNGDVLARVAGDWINTPNIPVAVATTIHAATPKATPVGADELGYLNSAASFELVKMTFTQLLAYLAIPTLPIKATGAEIDTGTDDAKFATPKAIEDSSYIKAAYADAKVTDAIADGVTTIAPSQNAVFDALALKIATSVLDTDVTLAANSDAKIPSQKAIKTYVDAIAQGLDIKGSVRVATTANITLSGAQTIDGVAVIAGERVLVKDQTLGATNGIYVAAAGVWSRAVDADVSAEVTAGMFTFVSEGTVNGDNGFALTTNDPIVLGTTVLVFTQVSGAGQIVAGNALTKTGNQLDWAPDGTTLEVASDQGRVKDAGISNAKLANMAAATVKGQIVGGSGAPVDLTTAQLIAIIEAGAIYALLAGRSGGQTLKGDTASGGNLTLMSTSHATKGKLLFGASAYDEVNDRLGIGNTAPGFPLDVQATVDGDVRVRIGNNYYNAASSDDTASLEFSFYANNAAALRNAALIQAIKSDNWTITSNRDAHLAFSTADNGVLAEWVRILNTGQVGVGTPSPTAQLEVLQPTLGSAVLRLSSTATNDDPNETMYQNRLATTNATDTLIFAIPVPASTAVLYEYTVIGRRTGGSAGAAEDSYYVKGGAFLKNTAGTVSTLAGSAYNIGIANPAGWGGLTSIVSGTNLNLQVGGLANVNVSWHITVRVWQISS